MALISDLVQSIRRVGFFKTLIIIYNRFYDLWFDYKYNLSTSKRVKLEELKIDSPSKKQGQMYQPTSVLALKKLLKTVSYDFDNGVFIDFGSGKGRTLLIASLFNFDKLIGVEFSKELCDESLENIKHFKEKEKLVRHKNFIIENIDARKYSFKGDENFFYFFYPFDDEIMLEVLKKIEASLKENYRKAYIIYYLPIHQNVIENHNNYSQVFSLKKKFTLSGYPCFIYEN